MQKMFNMQSKILSNLPRHTGILLYLNISISSGSMLFWPQLSVCSCLTHLGLGGVFLDLSVSNPNQLPPEFYCHFYVLVWYRWTKEMANQPKFAHLTPHLYQLQEATTIVTKSPHLAPALLPPSPITSSLPPAALSSLPKSVIWVEFLTCCQKHYEECVQKETPQQKQVQLSRLLNPPKINAKVFEWVVNDNGNLF
jgi:hypothetical protein